MIFTTKTSPNSYNLSTYFDYYMLLRVKKKIEPSDFALIQKKSSQHGYWVQHADMSNAHIL